MHQHLQQIRLLRLTRRRLTRRSLPRRRRLRRLRRQTRRRQKLRQNNNFSLDIYKGQVHMELANHLPLFICRGKLLYGGGVMNRSFLYVFSFLIAGIMLGSAIAADKVIVKLVAGDVVTVDAAVKILTIKGRKAEVVIATDERTTIKIDKEKK